MMRILVTGAAGFIGSHFVEHLLLESDLPIGCVVSYDCLTYAGNLSYLDNVMHDPRHHFIRGDVCDTEHVRKTLADFRISIVVHLAAETHVDRAIDAASVFVTSNVVGTASMLQAFYQHWRQVELERPLFLQVSTDEVFGSLGVEEPAFDEDSSYRPNSPYSASKAAADHLVHAYAHTHGLPAIIVHPSNNYGPRQFPEKLIPLMIRKMLKAEDLPIYGDGQQIRDWIYVKDTCRALSKIMQFGKLSQRYLIGARCERSNREMVEMLIEVMRRLFPEKMLESGIVHVTDRPGHDRRYAINPSRIESELGWFPSVSLVDGLEQTVEWIKQHEIWAKEIEERGYLGERLGLPTD